MDINTSNAAAAAAATRARGAAAARVPASPRSASCSSSSLRRRVVRQRCELANYHSLFRADMGRLPGFPTLGLNGSGAFISPVAQLLAHLAAGLRRAAAGTLRSLPDLAPGNTSRLTPSVFGVAELPCLQAAVVCTAGDEASGAVDATVLLLNRCPLAQDAEGLPSAVDAACGGTGAADAASWRSIVYPATLGKPGAAWARLPAVGAEPPWGAPLAPRITDDATPGPAEAMSFAVFERVREGNARA